MKKILYTTILLAGMAAQAQTFEWLQTPAIDLNMNSDMVGYSVANDLSGNVYMTGFKNNAYAYSDIMGNLYYNKYDGNGQLLFSKEIGGRACNHNMVSDPQGNVLMALGYVGNITIDGIEITTTEQGDHFVLAKFDPQSNLLWHKLIITEEEFTWTNEFKALEIDAQGNIYIGYDNYGTSYIEKYSPDGAKMLGIAQQHVNTVTSVSVDSEGNIYAAGSCADTMATFGGVAVPSPFQYNTYIVKYSPQGVYQWIRYTDNITCPDVKVVARTPNEVYYSSYLFGAYAFGDITAEGPGQNMFEDFFLAKLDATGTFQWVREVEGEGKVAQGKRDFLTLDNDGNIYFTGLTGGNIDWGNGITTNTPPMGEDIFIVKYSPEGVALMAKTAGGEGYDRADSVSVNADGDIYIAGMGNGTAAFDSFVHEAGQYERYPYLAKITTSTMGTNDPKANSILLYPNPANDHIFLSGIDGKVKGSIINMLGQKITDFEADAASPVTVQQLAAGTYFIKPEGLPALRFVKN
jgi:Secretion system C-terminal sorting domain